MVVEPVEPIIYFGTQYGGLQSYSPATLEVKNLTNSTEWVSGVTYDSIQDKIYWAGYSRIWRGNRDGSQVEMVVSMRHYGLIWALDFDWIAGNVYASTSDGYIIACHTGTQRTSACVQVLNGQGNTEGIALNPIEGIMYFTNSSSSGSINRAHMDGYDPRELVSGPNVPVGITIDFQNSRLYWTCTGDAGIQSSDMQGLDIQTILRYSSSWSWVWGISLSNDRIYFTDFITNKMGSSSMTGQDVRLLLTGTVHLRHVSVVPRTSLPRNRTDHCENHTCSGVCVLTPTSFSCLF